MTDLVNFVRVTENGLLGNIASMAYDIDFTGVPYTSTNPKAPEFKLYAKSPRGKQVEIGAVWRKYSENTKRHYLTVTIHTGHGTLNANLGKYPEQDDEDLMSIIPWD
ncbi:DUF736 domain-containing protein [Allorhizobium sp. BGMRC 0089]|uniref:DUF736 family protein n=1 Tax=Allorhizobium sonneratiae TaxID=2934936 RepID=UPI0020333287|nr:DUF736 family protein [Allorhizobium sonneratiae]MCM2294809.1 DUF736 domain-containing protein [Allorhizobium sonneratiae]